MMGSFYINPEITISDIIALISFISIAIGGLFTLVKWNKTNSLKRAEYINQLIEKVRSDESISKAMYLFDYSHPWYDIGFHDNAELEQPIDKLLTYYSYICYLREMKIIGKSEFGFFEYDIERILRNSSTMGYFYNLFHFSKSIEVPFMFEILLNYAKKNNYYKDDFWDPEAWKQGKYPHYLNF